MVGYCRTPGLQDAGQARLRAHHLGVGGDGHDRFRRSLEQQAIDRPLIPIGGLGDSLTGSRLLANDERDGWQGEDHVEIFHGQQVLGAGLHPVTCSWSLTLSRQRRASSTTDNVGSCNYCRRCGGGRTWCSPPSASVRQASIADITFSWERPTCPAWACRHAGPCARNMSAISSVGRGTSPGRYCIPRRRVSSCSSLICS
jgi:hypothetical protein